MDLDQNDPHNQPYNETLLPAQIESDLSCIQCGYNLRGMSPGGTCPECGAPVHLSNRSDRLMLSDSQWLGSLRYGMNWIVAGIVVSLCIFVLSVFAGMFIMSSNLVPTPAPAPGSSPMTQPTMPAWFTVFSVIAAVTQSVVFGMGFWQLTRPEPARFGEAPASCAVTRWTLLPSFALSIVSTALDATQSPSAMYASQIILFIAMLLVLVGVPASLIYLRLLALRLPDPGLARQTSIVFWGVLATGGAMVIVSIFVMVFTFAPVSGTTQGIAMGITLAMGLIICPAMIALLVFGIWWIVLMFLYRGRFTHVHNIASEYSRHGDMNHGGETPNG